MDKKVTNIAPQLPVWLKGQDVTTLAKVAQDFWQQIESHLFWWLEQQHSENAQAAILDLLAWERGITRLPNESITLFGLRVKHAFANATDAGYGLGMEQIFKRLGFGFIEISERLPGLDWDMVEVAMLETEFSGNENLVTEVIKQYGRTCRRYFLTALVAVDTVEAIGLVEFEKEVAG
jgi:hypothetical protein